MKSDSIVADLQRVKVALESSKSEYLCLISDMDYSLKVAELYAGQLRKKKDEVNKLNRELENAQEGIE